jgi:hypothetical protein
MLAIALYQNFLAVELEYKEFQKKLAHCIKVRRNHHNPKLPKHNYRIKRCQAMKHRSGDGIN